MMHQTLLNMSVDKECASVGFELGAESFKELVDLEGLKAHDINSYRLDFTRRSYLSLLDDQFLISLPEMYESWAPRV